MRRIHSVATLIVVLAGLLAGCTATGSRGGEGVELFRTADVFCGSSFNCTRPAVFDYDRVKQATAEWKTIMTRNVQPGSARYELLTRAMHEKLRTRIQKVAGAHKCDLVVRAGDIRDAHGLEILDLTTELLDG